MTDIHIRREGHAGRITLQRPEALNAMTYAMCVAIEDAIDTWRNDPAVDLVIFDAEGEKAFCAGGDIAQLYETGTKGDFAFGQKFWADEYRLNAKIFEYPKPVVSFLQGYTMGGGVGIGCHGSHRVVGDTSRVAMPECAIGLMPDVGGTFMLALAPGRLGEFLGITGHRMNAGLAITAGFADHYLPEAHWPAAIAALCDTADTAALEALCGPAPAITEDLAEIDRLFAGEALSDILTVLRHDGGEFAQYALQGIGRGSPLSMACTIEALHRLRGPTITIRRALEMEYRFTYRAMEHGDFLEGIRAQIIDKDRSPKWKHDLDKVPAVDVSRMLMPLPEGAGLVWDKGSLA